MSWTKDSDWLPLDNATAQVEFWERDLQYAQQYLDYVKSFKDRKLKNWNVFYAIALKDVRVSINGLAHAKVKLIESERLEHIGRVN